MSILSDFEDRVSGAVEGVFAGVFRSPVQPAELARACAKEMDRRKQLGVGKVYAPTMYSVLLSPKDGDALGGFAETLAGELATYLVGYARERDYALAARPVVRFLIDDELKLGRFVVIGELLSPEEIAAELGEPEGSVRERTPSPQSPAPSCAAAHRRRARRLRRRGSRPRAPRPSSGDRDPDRSRDRARHRTRRRAHGHRPAQDLRHLPRGRERLARARGARARGRRLGARGPRLDQRHARSTASGRTRPAARRRRHHDRHLGARLSRAGELIRVIDVVLLAGRLLLLALLYLFLFAAVRAGIGLVSGQRTKRGRALHAHGGRRARLSSRA